VQFGPHCLDSCSYFLSDILEDGRFDHVAMDGLKFGRHEELAADDAGLIREALAIAQQQRAKSWELRATTSLARLWSAQSRRREAYDLLAPLYDWFTEGFDTVPLKEARELLDTLRDTRRFGSGQRRRGAGRPFG